MNLVRKIWHFQPTEMHHLKTVLRVLLVPLTIIFILLWLDYLSNPLAMGIYRSGVTNTSFVRLLIPLGIFLVYFPTGMLIYRKTPNHLIALLMLNIGLCSASFLTSYQTPWWLVVAQSVFVGFTWQCIFYVPIVFPDGKALNSWSKWLLTINIWYSLFVGILGIFGQRLINGGPGRIPYPNPLFIESIEPIYRSFGLTVWSILVLPIVALVFISPIMRFRRTKPGSQARQQIKWLALLSVVLTLLLSSYILFAFLLWEIVFNEESLEWYILFYTTITVFASPIILGNAILRHRLYDIDIIIRRTLIYSILSAILAGVYLGTVILVQQLFQSATGDVPDFAIVLSTLLIAGLFTPVRRRVQDVIDRRFYRRKYNVEQTLAQFSQTLRDEVDIEVLKGQLVSVVQDTMQPSSIRLWVKENKS